MVCIQFNYINNINLQFGMDVTKLYSDECDEGFLGYINSVPWSTMQAAWVRR